MNDIKSMKEFYDIIEQGHDTVIYWYTTWCPDCFAIKPHLPRLEQDFPEATFCAFDRNIDIDLARHLEIYGIPSFLVFRNGVETSRYVDKYRKTYDQVKAFLTEALN